MKKVVLKKSNGEYDTFFVFESLDGIHPTGGCIEVFDNVTDVLLKYGGMCPIANSNFAIFTNELI